MRALLRVLHPGVFLGRLKPTFDLGLAGRPGTHEVTRGYLALSKSAAIFSNTLDNEINLFTTIMATSTRWWASGRKVTAEEVFTLRLPRKERKRERAKDGAGSGIEEGGTASAGDDEAAGIG